MVAKQSIKCVADAISKHQKLAVLIVWDGLTRKKVVVYRELESRMSQDCLKLWLHQLKVD